MFSRIVGLATSCAIAMTMFGWSPSFVVAEESPSLREGETVFFSGSAIELKVGDGDSRQLVTGTPVRIVKAVDEWVQVSVSISGESLKKWLPVSSVSRESGVSPPGAATQDDTQPTLADRFNQMLAQGTVPQENDEPAQEPASAAAGNDQPPQDEPAKKAAEPAAAEPTQEQPQQPTAEPAKAATAEPPAASSAAGTEPTADTPPAAKEQDAPAKEEAPSEPSSEAKPLPEGPDALAEKFAKLLAERLNQAPAKKADEAEQAAEEAEEELPVEPEEALPPTVSVLVLRSPEGLLDVSMDERYGQLTLTGDSFTNRSLRDLPGLTASMLSIEAVNVSNTAIQYVAQVKGIRQLRLWSPGIDDGALSMIARLRGLERLDLEGTAVDGSGFADLKNLKRLTTLVLGARTTDAAIANLKLLPTLRRLDLRACDRLTEDCLEQIAELKQLEIIWLPRHIRTKGKRALRSTLPDCRVRS